MTTILIVDDDSGTRIFLEALLQQEGYQAITAVNGQEALVRLDEGRCDLILMDIHMPVMNGYQATERLKMKYQQGRFVPVIFLTSAQTDLELARCLECGGDDFLTKPPNPIILKARIKAWLQRAELHLAMHQAHIQLRQQYMALQEMDNLRKDVEAISRHDLKSPLNGIIGCMELLLLEDVKLTQPEINKYYHLILDAANQMQEMVNMSMNLINMEQGRYEAILQPVPLLPLIHRILSNHRKLIDRKQIAIAITVDGRPVQDQRIKAFCVACRRKNLVGLNAGGVGNGPGTLIWNFQVVGGANG
ncbi:MAG: response regulator, partial [Magnetococcales bacterium]|nr:response regulator [Magnetococcales bacterium]